MKFNSLKELLNKKPYAEKLKRDKAAAIANHFKNKYNLEIVAYCGFAGFFSKNTLLSVYSSIELGVDGIELDIRHSNRRNPYCHSC